MDLKGDDGDRLEGKSGAVVAVTPAPESLENLEDMSPRYYSDSYVISRFKYLTTHCCVIRRGLIALLKNIMCS